MLQSRCGIVNLEHRAQEALLKKVDAGAISLDALRSRAGTLLEEELAALEAPADMAGTRARA